MLGLGYRGSQSSPSGLPIEGEERAALPLNRDRLINEVALCALVKIHYEAMPGLLDQLRALSYPAVAL